MNMKMSKYKASAKHGLQGIVLALCCLPVTVFADSVGPLDPFPITGAYSALHVGDRENISIIEISGNYNKNLLSGQVNVEPRAVIAQEFFRTHPDNYDFIIAFSTFEFDTGEALAFHWPTQNTVQGLGLRQFNVTDLFGSPGARLKGFTDMAALSRWSLDKFDPKFELALSTLSHEVLHQWAAYVAYREADGTNSTVLLGRDAAHWSALFDTNASVQYGADWRDNGDGTYTSTGIRTFYSPLDLYLMGFYSANEVPPMTLIQGTDINSIDLPQNNITITGTPRTITIDNIIAANGPRIPSAADSQKEFRFAFVLLTGQGEVISNKTLAGLNELRNAFMTRFNILTGGRGIARVYPEALPVGQSGTSGTIDAGTVRTNAVNLDEAIIWLRANQGPQFWEDKPTTRVRDTIEVIKSLSRFDPNFSGLSKARAGLSLQTDLNTDYLARYTILLNNQNADTSTQLAELISRQNTDGGWGLSKGYQSDVLDTALALRAMGKSSAAIAYINRLQVADGSWPFSVGGAGQIASTLESLLALHSASALDAIRRTNALNWLASQQRADGGFGGQGSSSLLETAYVLDTLISIEGVDAVNADAASTYLLSRQNVDGSWGGSTYVTALVVRTLRRFNFTNWMIESFVATPAAVLDGQRVRLDMVIRNDSGLTTPAGILRLFDGDPSSGVTSFSGDIAIPVIVPGRAYSFSYYWDTLNLAGAHLLFASVDPDGTTIEMVEADNINNIALQVNPAPAGIELEVTREDITFIPETVNAIPAIVGINVNLRNLGLTDASSVRVVLRAGVDTDAPIVDETTINISNRTSMVVNFNTTLTTPGTATYSVQIDPDNTIIEAAEDNNVASKDIATLPSFDLVVTNADIAADTTTVILGQDVNFNVSLHNNGTVEVPSAIVSYLVTDGTNTQILQTSQVTLAAGETQQKNIIWRANLTGNITFTVQFDQDNLVPELDENNNVGSRAFVVNAASGVNLIASYQDFTFNPNPAFEGGAVTLNAVIKNLGDVAATNVQVAFYDNDPDAGGNLIGTIQVIPSIAAAGGSAPVSVVWNQVPDNSDKLLYVVADPANAIIEFDENDNRAFNILSVLALPDLAISSGDIVLNPAFPRAGDTVTVNARVTNTGQQNARSILVRAYNGDPSAGGVLIGDQTIATLASTQSQSITFSTSFASLSDAALIVVQVDPLGTVTETNRDNNTARRNVAVQDGDVFVDQRFFSPNNDGVKDTVNFSFRLQTTETVTVEVVNTRGSVVRRFNNPAFTNTTNGSAIWDGLDDQGRLVADGVYVLRVVGAGGSLGAANVTLDNNRSSLLKAVDTPYELFTNMTCKPDNYWDFGLSADDQKAFFYSATSNPSISVTPRGVYSMNANGSDVRNLTPLNFWYGTNDSNIGIPVDIANTDDGSKLVFVRIIYNPREYQFWTVNSDGSGLRNLQITRDPSLLYNYSASVESFYTILSILPDNNTFYYLERLTDIDFRVMRADIEGGFTPVEIYRMTNTAGYREPNIAISKDKKHIVFYENTSNNERSYKVLNLSTGVVKSLFVDAYYAEPFTHTDYRGYRVLDFSAANWSQDSSKFILTFFDYMRVYSADGQIVREYSIPEETKGASSKRDLPYFESFSWSSTGSEFVVKVKSSFGGSNYSTQPRDNYSGLFVANTANSEFKKAATVFDAYDCSECASYHISTKQGGRWVERGKLSYDRFYREQQLDLSEYLPDSEGDYKVRIRQVSKEAAHIDSVAMLQGAFRFVPSRATQIQKLDGWLDTLLRYAIGETHIDVLDKLIRPDNEVLDAFERTEIIHWNKPDHDTGEFLLALFAREEALSRLNTRPFDYPKQKEAYLYTVKNTGGLTVDGELKPEDKLGEPLFNEFTRPETGHPPGRVYGYVKSDASYIYAALDFTVDNTLDGLNDWAKLRIRKPGAPWQEFTVTVKQQEYGFAGFTKTQRVPYTHKYYEFKIPLTKLGIKTGDQIEVAFQAYGTAAKVINPSRDLPAYGVPFWVPGERSIIYDTYPSDLAVLLDEGNEIKDIFVNYPNDYNNISFSPTGRKILFTQRSGYASAQCNGGSDDTISFESLLNLVVDLRALRSPDRGGVVLSGTASDENFSSYLLEYADVNNDSVWNLVAPESTQAVIDDEFTTWVPPAPGTYFVRLTISDLAGNTRQTIERVSWNEQSSLSDLYRKPAYISPNGDSVQDSMILHFRVLQPVHVEVNIYNQQNQRIKTIVGDYTTIGQNVNLQWDGRDDVGLLMPDGEYRIAVQDYEFRVTIDTTPPVLTTGLSEPYSFEEDPVSRKRTVKVNTELDWSVNDIFYVDSAVRKGMGINPTVWEEKFDLDPYENGIGNITTEEISSDEFTNYRFRLEATDKAGNRAVALSPEARPAYLMVERVGVVPKNANEKIRMESIKYVPMGDMSGGTFSDGYLFNTQTRLQFNIKETIPVPLASIEMQLAPDGTTQWQNHLTVSVNPIDNQFTTTVQGTLVSGLLIARFHAVDINGVDYYSNTFKVVGGDDLNIFSFVGLIPDSPFADDRYADPDIPGDFEINSEINLIEPGAGSRFASYGRINDNYYLYGTVPKGKYAEARLYVISPQGTTAAEQVKFDPRYATEKRVDFVKSPTRVVFHTDEFTSCRHYKTRMKLFGKIDQNGNPEKDLDGNLVEAETSDYREFDIPCIDLSYKVQYETSNAQCGEPVNDRVTVQFAPHSTDGSGLKLLTFGTRDPSTGIENIVFNQNTPETVIKSKLQNYLYRYDVDKAAFVDGVVNFEARLVNNNDEAIIRQIAVVIDRTPATAEFTYPLEGQTLCGIPTLGTDGVTRNVVTLEGIIDDVNGTHYELKNKIVGLVHDSRRFNSFNSVIAAEAEINPALRPYHNTSRIAGPIAAMTGISDQVSLPLIVHDKSGAVSCSTRTFRMDTTAALISAGSQQPIISPNGDGQFDQLAVTYNVAEPVNVDVQVFVANKTGNQIVATDSLVKQVATALPALPGESIIYWDGSDISGAVAADGYYAITLVIIDSCGNTAKREFFVQVDNTVPQVNITYPQTSDSLTMIAEVVGSVSDLHIKGYDLEYGIGISPTSWIRIGTGNSITNDVLGSWNTFGLTGDHVLRLTATDGVGNSNEALIPITIADRINLISTLEAVPKLFSPNGDGKRENSAIRITVEQDVTFTLQIMSGVTVVRTLATNQQVSPGSIALSWDGRNDVGILMADGNYSARISATLTSNPLVNQEETISVVLDTSPYSITLSRPNNGFVSATGAVMGTVLDNNPKNFTVSIRNLSASSGLQTLYTGIQSTANVVFGSLVGFDEGNYELLVQTEDAAEIVSNKTIPFVVDNTAPKIELVEPFNGEILGNNKAPNEVKVMIEETNIATYTLSIGAGANPTAWTELIQGTALPLPAVLTVLDASAYSDGQYSLRVQATDLANNTSELVYTIYIDNTAPITAITSPANNGYIQGSMNIVGTATDRNFAEYKLFVAPGSAATATRWSELTTSTVTVDANTLLNLSTLPPEGPHALKLVVTDAANNNTETIIDVTVDTKPPVAPVQLVAIVENRKDVRLTWSANSETDIAGYAVYRNGARITANLVPINDYLDVDAPQGPHEYSVIAVDLAGWESEYSNIANATIDTVAPTTKLSKPGEADRVQGLYDIMGTAYSETDFREYRVYIGEGTSPTVWTMIRQSPVPTLSDLLSQWNTVVLTDSVVYSIKLESEDLTGNIGTDTVVVTIDNLPPAAPTGLQAVVNVSDVNLTWNANTETDLLGYLLFRDGQLANVVGVAVGDLAPYTLDTTAYADLQQPDGTYNYTVVAIDTAGNISTASIPQQVAIDTRPPHAVFVEPLNGFIFDSNVYVLATTEDNDIQNVRFEYRLLGNATWSVLIATDTAQPYETTFDPVALGLAYNDYELRAIATDTNTQVDPSPEIITVTYKDLTPPVSVTNVTRLVNGGDVTLSWIANTETDLAGYHVERVNPDKTVTRLTSTAITTTTYIDTALVDETYQYQIVSIDTSDNEAKASNTVTAIVYTPGFVQPYTPVTDTIVTISGNGIVPATVSATVTNGLGTRSLTSVTTDVQNNFVFIDQALEQGDNTFEFRLTDAEGNVSKPAVVVIARGDISSAPTGVTAIANGFDVTVNWNPNPETNILGYRVFQDAQNIISDTPIRASNITSSSGFSPLQADDDSISTAWFSFEQGPWWIAFDYPSIEVISQLNIDWYTFYGLVSDYDIQAWTGSNWLTLVEIRNNTNIRSEIALPKPYRTNRIRLVIYKANDFRGNGYLSPGILEIETMRMNLVTDTTWLHNTVDGSYNYTVQAVNTYGFISNPSVPSAVDVGDVTPPEPVILAAVVSNSDVTLTWDASIASDVTRYSIYRNGTVISEYTDLLNLNFVDANRPNGTYIYTVRAVDAVGNIGLSSNDAVADVTVTPPLPPVSLTVSNVSVGGVLDLAWAPAVNTSPVSYQVLRSVTTGGPYTVMTNTSTTEYRDYGLTNGMTYFYVILALDGVGNISANSNEASGIPADASGPDLRVLSPTVPGRQYTSVNEYIAITGLTEPGTVTRLFQDGIALNELTARSSPLTEYFSNTNLDNFGLISPDGRYMHSRNNNGNQVILNLETGVQTKLLNPSGFFNSWSSIGTFIYRANDGGYLLREFNPDTRSFADLTTPGDYLSITNFKLSDDRSVLVIIGNRGGQLVADRIDMQNNTRQQIFVFTGSYNLYSQIISRDGTKFAFTSNTAPAGIYILDLNTAQITSVYSGQFNLYQGLKWSPDSESLMFITGGGASQPKALKEYNIVKNELKGLYSPVYDYSSHFYAPDGKRYAVKINTDTYSIKDINTNTELYNISAPYIQQWLGSGVIIAKDLQNDEFKVYPPGYFEFLDVRLREGDNVFSILGEDANGFVTEPAQQIVATYDNSTRADLVVLASDIKTIPTAPIINEQVRITVTVRNIGAVDANNSSTLSLLVVAPDSSSVILLNDISVNALAAGQGQTFTADMNLGNLSGTYSLVALVDTQNQIPESSEANNTTIKDIIVAGDALPQVKVSTDSDRYESEQDVTIDASVFNSGADFSGMLTIRIEDQQGFTVATVLNESVSNLATAQTLLRQQTWNTGSTFSGNYLAKTYLTNSAGQRISKASAQFSIANISEVTSLTSTDQEMYSSNANVSVTGKVAYIAGNTVLSGVSAVMRVQNAAGTVQSEKTVQMGDLLPGSSSNLTMGWNTQTIPAGEYTTTLTVLHNSQVISNAQSSFQVIAGIDLSGTVVLSQISPEPGLGQDVTFTVSNEGNNPVSQLPIIVSLYDPVLQVTIDSFNTAQDIALGGQYQASTLFSKDTLRIQNYTVILQVDVVLPDATLARVTLNTASFAMVDRSAPLVEIREPGATSFVRTGARTLVYAIDALSPISTVEVNVDGTGWINAALYSTSDQTYSVLMSNLTEGAHTITARGSDTSGNQNMTPALAFSVDSTLPDVVIIGVNNNGYYNAAVTPIITITDTNLTRSTVTLNGQPFVSTTVVDAAGIYSLVASGTDAADNITTREVNFTIDRVVPQITITGVTDGSIYNVDVTPVIKIVEDNPGSEVITLNGQPFVSGTLVNANGVYELIVNVEDLAGNVSSESLSFEIDTTAPEVVISAPADGAVLTNNVTDISGSTEPLATVYITVGTYQTNVLANDAGLFNFSQVPLVNGENQIQAYAQDRATNTGSTISQTVTVGLTQVAKLNAVVKPASSILIYWPYASDKHCHKFDASHSSSTGDSICHSHNSSSDSDHDDDDEYDNSDGHDSDGEHYFDSKHDSDANDEQKLLTLLDTILRENDQQVKIVHKQNDFVSELRSQRYGTLLIVDLDGHSSVNFSDELTYELQAMLASGSGMLWIKNNRDRTHWNDDWEKVSGAKIHYDYIAGSYKIILEQSDISQAGLWNADGKAIMTIPVISNDVGIGVLDGNKDSYAFIKNTYSGGNLILMPFNPADITNTDGGAIVLRNLLDFIQAKQNDYLPGSVFDVKWEAGNLSNPFEAIFRQSLTIGMDTVSVWNGTVIDPLNAQWNVSINTDTESFRSLIRLPQSKGEFKISGALTKIENTIEFPIVSNQEPIQIRSDQAELGIKLMDRLNAMQVSGETFEDIQKAIQYIQYAIIRVQNSQDDAAYSIYYLSKAYEELVELDVDVTYEAGLLGGLLRTYQSRWFILEQ